jgi:hypothetical protein
MNNLNRALALLLLCGVPLLLLTPRTKEALARRSPLVFYSAATILIALFCCGPVLRVGDEVVLSPAPYRWLLALPGFNELRVPTRFWMLGILCLSAAAGLAFRAIRPRRVWSAAAVFSIAAVGLLLDGWMPVMRMATPPDRWEEVEPRGRLEPILELPIGGDGDWAATFRAIFHRRRVVNGVSGYSPPHYDALVAGLQAGDPATLKALASLGPFDVVVDRAGDPDGRLARYASGASGALRVADDGARTTYRIPQGPAEAPLGEALPITRVEAIRGEPEWRFMHDGRIDTGWGDYPQKPDAWVLIDLGSVREVGGVTHAIGDYFLDYPRRLAIELSEDGQGWQRAWEGSTAAQTFLAYVEAPRVGALRFAFDARRARFVKLLQLESSRTMWRVSELQVHAPARQPGR